MDFRLHCGIRGIGCRRPRIHPDLDPRRLNSGCLDRFNIVLLQMSGRLFLDRKVLSWALYDWANSAFATTVVAGFFPVLYSHMTRDLTTQDAQIWLNVTIAAGSIVVGISSPILGAIADSGNQRKTFLAGFTLLGILMCLGLGWAASGLWWMALILYGIGLIGFNGAITFYNSLLVLISSIDQVDLVSGFGYALGYIGGGLLFLINVLMVTNPAWFGFESTSAALAVSFVSVGIWWFIFSLPLFLFIREPGAARTRSIGSTVGEGWHRFKSTIREVRMLRTASFFLIGYWLYIDGVATIFKMAVFFADRILGLPSDSLIKALLLTQFVAFPAALVFGWLGKKMGPKFGISICIAVYVIVITYAWQWLRSALDFYFLAVGIGLVQGGIQGLSRSLFARLIPASKTAEFFGFFNLVGRFSSILGPLMMILVPILIVGADERDSILALLVLFAGGAYFLWKVDIASGVDEARRLDDSIALSKP